MSERAKYHLEVTYDADGKLISRKVNGMSIGLKWKIDIRDALSVTTIRLKPQPKISQDFFIIEDEASDINEEIYNYLDKVPNITSKAHFDVIKGPYRLVKLPSLNKK